MGKTFSGFTNDPYLGLQAKYRWPLTEPSFFPGLRAGGRKKHKFYRGTAMSIIATSQKSKDTLISQETYKYLLVNLQLTILGH